MPRGPPSGAARSRGGTLGPPEGRPARVPVTFAPGRGVSLRYGVDGAPAIGASVQRRLVMALVSIMAVGIAACGGGGDPTTVTSPQYLLRRDGDVGHCVMGFGGTVVPVECSSEHTIEVIGTVEYPVDMPYPEGGIPMEFFEDCDADFADYVGRAPDRTLSVPDHLRSTPVIPSSDAWEMGDHRVVCTARSDVPWSGSVRDLGDLHPRRGPETELARGSFEFPVSSFQFV